MTDPTHGQTPASQPGAEPTPSVPEPSTSPVDHAVDSSSTQSIPSTETQAMPTAYQYPSTGQPGQSGQSGQAPSLPQAGAPEATGASAPVGLADEKPAGPRGGGGKRTGLLVGGLAAALVLGGGAVYATQQLSGGGAQPSDVLPGDSYAYLRLDVDPSAGQKIAAVRFLDKLPQVKDNLGSGDPRKKLWEAISKESSDDCVKQFNYDNDIAPWLGDRVGMSVRPGGTKDKPNVAVAVQATDEAKATDVLTKLMACGDGKADVRTKDGYAILTPAGIGDSTLAAIDKGNLTANATFSEDMKALGEQGVMSAWMDAAPAFKEFPKLSGDSSMSAVDSSAVKGRFAAALRFDPGYIELAGISRGAVGNGDIKTVTGDGAELANLPDDTVAALHFAGLDETLGSAWPQLKKAIDGAASSSGEGDVIGQIESQLDVKLPDDLKVLLGRSLTISLPDQQLGNDVPAVGAKIVSSDAARADALVGKIEDLSDASGLLTRKVDGDKLYLATKPDYAAKLQSGGSLGDSEAFKAAMGDASKSNAAMYVDLDKLEKQYLSNVPDEYRPAVEALRAVGLNTSVISDTEATFSLRVASN